MDILNDGSLVEFKPQKRSMSPFSHKKTISISKNIAAKSPISSPRSPKSPKNEIKFMREFVSPEKGKNNQIPRNSIFQRKKYDELQSSAARRRKFDSNLNESSVLYQRKISLAQNTVQDSCAESDRSVEVSVQSNSTIGIKLLKNRRKRAFMVPN